MMKTIGKIILMGCLVGSIFTSSVQAARIKDLAAIKGIRSNQLTGYGLIVGLDGTGDEDGVGFTKQALANMMAKMKIYVHKAGLSVANVAGVIVTADIPPFARIGDRMDVMVSSLGDAKSLKGGTLLVTPLRGVDDRIYALAQGSAILAIPAGAGDRDSHLLVARIPNVPFLEVS